MIVSTGHKAQKVAIRVGAIKYSISRCIDVLLKPSLHVQTVRHELEDCAVTEKDRWKNRRNGSVLPASWMWGWGQGKPWLLEASLQARHGAS